ncbi:UNVERIFIED_CONTAM: hypothetical protein GTU68_013237 [Idotea baltica]|nr:hypothetical protein [Idotea baltica]
MEALKFVNDQLRPEKELPDFKAGDNISVYYKIVEGGKERIQVFKGNVIQIKNERGTNSRTFTVRKVSSGVGVERIFPLNSPNIDNVVINKHGRVRRARLFYLREAMGKKARIKERRFLKKN